MGDVVLTTNAVNHPEAPYCAEWHQPLYFSHSTPTLELAVVSLQQEPHAAAGDAGHPSGHTVGTAPHLLCSGTVHWCDMGGDGGTHLSVPMSFAADVPSTTDIANTVPAPHLDICITPHTDGA